MIFIKDKILIFLISFGLYIIGRDILSVLPILCILIISGLNTYTNRLSIRLIGMLIYFYLCSYCPDYLYFLPLIAYDIGSSKRYNPICLVYLFLFSMLIRLSSGNLSELMMLFLLSISAYYLKFKSSLLDELTQLHYHSKNQLEDTASLLAQKNKALLEKQDSEIHIATLNERNRIAREIHDNVGHILSRCLLQIGALMVLAKKEPVLYQGLDQIKNTLTEAMNSIRTSVHNLHDESLDLKAELTKLVNQFDFCHISLDYDLSSSPNKEIKYSFIAVVKEALSNVMKHSHATQVEITVREHPAFYQLIVKDNDLGSVAASSNGIGLNNMQERISQLDGQFSIDTTKGFKIFISVPKK